MPPKRAAEVNSTIAPTHGKRARLERTRFTDAQFDVLIDFMMEPENYELLYDHSRKANPLKPKGVTKAQGFQMMANYLKERLQEKPQLIKNLNMDGINGEMVEVRWCNLMRKYTDHLASKGKTGHGTLDDNSTLQEADQKACPHFKKIHQIFQGNPQHNPSDDRDYGLPSGLSLDNSGDEVLNDPGPSSRWSGPSDQQLAISYTQDQSFATLAEDLEDLEDPHLNLESSLLDQELALSAPTSSSVPRFLSPSLLDAPQSATVAGTSRRTRQVPVPGQAHARIQRENSLSSDITDLSITSFTSFNQAKAIADNAQLILKQRALALREKELELKEQEQKAAREMNEKKHMLEEQKQKDTRELELRRIEAAEKQTQQMLSVMGTLASQKVDKSRSRRSKSVSDNEDKRSDSSRSSRGSRSSRKSGSKKRDSKEERSKRNRRSNETERNADVEE